MSKPTDSLTEPQRLWIEALRSGIFKQTTHVLCRLDEKGEPVGFCCLGVACEIARVAGVKVEVGRDVVAIGDDEPWPVRSFNGSKQWMPEAVMEWLGLTTQSGHYDGDALSNANDSGEPFESIADIIESKPEGLFVEGPA